jgi:hypothetical protein
MISNIKIASIGTVLLFCGLIFYLQSCSKKEQETTLPTSTNAVPILSELPKLKVQDNTLFFEDVEQFFAVRKLLKTKSDEEILAWTRGLGFISVMDYYLQAVEFNCCPESADEMDQIVEKFDGKVRIDKTEGTFVPLIERGTDTWLLNEKGDFFVGSFLERFTNEKTISIQHPNPEKIIFAESNNVFDTVNHIYSHSNFVAENEVNDRACPIVVPQDGAVLVNCCPGNCYVAGESPYKYKVNVALRKITDDSGVYGNGSGGSVYNVSYRDGISLECRKRGLLGTWPTCHRVIWTYRSNLSWSFTMSEFSSSGTNDYPLTTTTAPECKFDKIISFLDLGNRTPAEYDSRSLTINSMSLFFSCNPEPEKLITGTSTMCF